MARVRKQTDSKEKKAFDRSMRLKAALQANLQRRKKQSKLRQEDTKSPMDKDN